MSEWQRELLKRDVVGLVGACLELHHAIEHACDPAEPVWYREAQERAAVDYAKWAVRQWHLIERVGADRTARDIFEDRAETGDTQRQSMRVQAMGLLREKLAEGPKPMKEVEALAANRGISEATLQKARRRIGVLSTKDGFAGEWFWSLPTPSGDTSLGGALTLPSTPKVDSSSRQHTRTVAKVGQVGGSLPRGGEGGGGVGGGEGSEGGGVGGGGGGEGGGGVADVEWLSDGQAKWNFEGEALSEVQA